MSNSDYDAPIETLDEEEKLGRFRDWFKLSSEAFAEHRKLAARAIEFQIPSKQWPEGTNRKGRPTIEVDLLRHPKQIVQNQASQANIGVELSPVSPDATTELAEIKQGLYARSQRDGGAKVARLWGLDYAKQAGLGWYRITTQYDEDSDDLTDQEIVYERILHQEMVYPDPAAQRPDFSDGRFLFLAAFVPVDSVGADYEKAEYASAAGFKDFVTTNPDWVRVEGENCSVLMVECFYKVKRKKDGEKRNRPVVWRAVLTGKEILEDKPYLAPTDKPEEGRRYIPFVPVVGNELQPVAGKRYWEGMVGPAMGSQIAHNFFASTLIESVASEPKNPIMAPDESVMPYQKQWNDLATGNPAYLPFKAMSDGEGRPLQAPFRMPSDQGRMSIALLALGQSKDWVESTTAFNSSSLGDLPKRRDAQSGRAIQALQGATESGTSQYMDNLETISLPLDARIWLDMAPVIYDRPGRAAQVLGAENKSRQVILNAPYVDQGGRPVPIAKAKQYKPDDVKNYDLSKGKYSVVPTVGKPPQTRLERGQEFLTQVISAAPELMPIIGDLVFDFRDEPGAKEIAKRLRKNLAPNLLDDPKGSPEQAQAQVSNLQAQVQQLTQHLQEAMQAIQTKQVEVQAKAQADVQIETLRQQTKAAEIASAERMRHEDNATKILVARLGNAQDAANTAAEVKEELLATGIRVQAEAQATAVAQQHEARLAHEGQSHDMAMTAASTAHAAQQAQEQRAHDAALTSQGQAHDAAQTDQQQAHDAAQAAADRAAQPQADGASE